jgi:hypothetical protein
LHRVHNQEQLFGPSQQPPPRQRREAQLGADLGIILNAPHPSLNAFCSRLAQPEGPQGFGNPRWGRAFGFDDAHYQWAEPFQATRVNSSVDMALERSPEEGVAPSTCGPIGQRTPGHKLAHSMAQICNNSV